MMWRSRSDRRRDWRRRPTPDDDDDNNDDDDDDTRRRRRWHLQRARAFNQADHVSERPRVDLGRARVEQLRGKKERR